LVELLAPAGSKEALTAAVESGADAIYLAGSVFGARAYANNFDEDGLREAIHFAHLRGVLINVTVNTIIGDEELPALRDYLRFFMRLALMPSWCRILAWPNWPGKSCRICRFMPARR
jgi:putative protease